MDTFDLTVLHPDQLDVYDALEAEYVRAERAGMALDSILCADCGDPGLCAAEAECIGRAEGALDSSPTLPEWDVPA